FLLAGYCARPRFVRPARLRPLARHSHRRRVLPLAARSSGNALTLPRRRAWAAAARTAPAVGVRVNWGGGKTFWISDFGFRISDFGFWISDFGLRIWDCEF